MPSGILTSDSWVLASFEWLLAQRGSGDIEDWWRHRGWLARSIFDVATLSEAVRRRAPAPHPDAWAAFPQATLAAAIHLVRGDEDRYASAAALAAAASIGARRLVIHDLCLARALVKEDDESPRILTDGGLDQSLAEFHVGGLAAGDWVEGEVTGVASVGAFVRLGPTLDALLHVTELQEGCPSGVDPRQFVSSQVQVGESIQARVLFVDADARRVSLTCRNPHPWLDGVGLPLPGEWVYGVVAKVTRHGAYVALDGRLGASASLEVLGVEASHEEDVLAAVADTLPIGTRVRGLVGSTNGAKRIVELLLIESVPA